ncbi:hypothetical protein [Natronococcus roseus]|uniref:hypothetical protein n=1 Tax=Natronococcus roseus TaxID=1052014 RepID=UPI00374D59B3
MSSGHPEPYLPGDPRVVVGEHAEERFAERVIGADDPDTVRAAVGGRYSYRLLLLKHFSESLPCNMIVENPDKYNGEQARIHPETFTVWVFGDVEDSDHGGTTRVLITCWQYAARRVSIPCYSLCGECGILANSYARGECDHCGADLDDHTHDDPLEHRLEPNPEDGPHVPECWVEPPHAAEWVGEHGTLETSVGGIEEIEVDPQPPRAVADGGEVIES